MAGVMSAVRRDDRTLARGIRSAGPGHGRRGLASTRRAVDASQPLMDARAAAELLGVPSSWLLMAARDGRVPHHRIGRYVRFDLDELRAWLDETRIPLGQRSRGR